MNLGNGRQLAADATEMSAPILACYIINLHMIVLESFAAIYAAVMCNYESTGPIRSSAETWHFCSVELW